MKLFRITYTGLILAAGGYYFSLLSGCNEGKDGRPSKWDNSPEGYRKIVAFELSTEDVTNHPDLSYNYFIARTSDGSIWAVRVSEGRVYQRVKLFGPGVTTPVNTVIPATPSIETK